MEDAMSLTEIREQDLMFLGSIVKESLRKYEFDLSHQELGEICTLLQDLNGVDVAEIFSLKGEDDIILVCCKVSAREFGGRWVWPEASLASCESVKAREEGSVRASNRREVVDDTS